MEEILHDHVIAFFHGQVKMFLSSREGFQRTMIFNSSNSKPLSEGLASFTDIT